MQCATQLVLAAEMPVQRHRSDTEIGREPADRERLQARGVRKPERPVDDSALAQAGGGQDPPAAPMLNADVASGGPPTITPITRARVRGPAAPVATAAPTAAFSQR
jgi:hypothetical protein